MYKELHRSVFIRPENLIGDYANLTPSLGVTLYTDPSYRDSPVLELTQLQIDQCRNIVLSFQDDQKLATWNSREREDFYQEAFRSRVFDRFRGQRREHWANINAGVSVIFGDIYNNLTSNLDDVASGRIQWSSKDINGQFAWEMIGKTFNNDIAVADSLMLTGMNARSAARVIEGLFRATDNLQLALSDPQHFQAILTWGQKFASELVNSGQNYAAYINGVRNETEQFKLARDYFGRQMDNVQVLAVTPTPGTVDRFTDDERSPTDFSGNFAVRGHWYERPSTCRDILSPEDASKFGFNIGPAYFRQYQNLMNHLSSKSSEAGAQAMPSSLDSTPKVPLDLPEEIARQRLELFYNLGVDKRFPQTVRELQEVITAATLGRPVDIRQFREESVNHPPALRFIENRSVEMLEKSVKAAERQLTKITGNPDSTAGQIAVVEQKLREKEYWLQEHPDFEEPATQPSPA